MRTRYSYEQQLTAIRNRLAERQWWARGLLGRRSPRPSLCPGRGVFARLHDWYL